MNLLFGILLHGIGAFSASVCYTPQKKTVSWSWQTYWLMQAAVCWLLLPVIVAWITIPHLVQVLAEAPGDAMWRSFILGTLYGIGGTAFGLAIRYVGFSLTYAVSVGISCVLGTLLPPLYRDELGAVLSGTGGGWIICGITIGAIGIALCGLAGHSKEKDLAKRSSSQTMFSLSIGLPLCILAGVLSAVYGFSLDQGQPIADVAAQYGAGHFQGNVIYLFSNTGAFLSTMIYCIYLHVKQKTFREYLSLRSASTGRKAVLSLNYILAIITGVLWYTQFFFYGLGHVRMGAYKFTSWAIHMIMLVLISTLLGILLKEWVNSGKSTRFYLIAAIFTLIVSVVILTYGNYLGQF
ncbi:L-rhamnose/proton symporter RhaT [Agriterribacter sp.]|uniref:L-rhamnose/proton symporter RhaT n=1 Tax=Agriterribacter sp. TaxID=2821509 RepID=UPI002CB074D3|nr:L-rhamnose/proton symporter RhaT [Agriterribacter sp.]HRO45727.1 L-rhamnose/proton symporter RhaT [Agriterribacter sp.]HRQ15795.1 L-rhamnose/proton symporter RhaT [Agriterribacter sp.]